MSEDTSSAQSPVSSAPSSENPTDFQLKTTVTPVQHNTNTPKLSALCATSKACKTLMLISIFALFIAIIIIFIRWQIGLPGFGLAFAGLVAATVQNKKLQPQLFHYYRNGFVLSELKKYIQIEQFSDSVEPLNPPADPADQSSENPSENPSILTNKPWTHGRINQNFEGTFNDRRFRFFSAELVNAPSQDELMAFRTGTHVWNGQFYQFEVEKPFEKEIDIFSLPNGDAETPLEQRFVIKKHAGMSQDNEEYVKNGGDPYAIDVLSLQRNHAWSNAALRIYSAKKLSQKMAALRPEQANQQAADSTQDEREQYTTLAECGYDTPSMRQMLANLSSVLKNRCYTIRIRRKVVSIVIEGIDDPFAFPAMDADRSAIAACSKLQMEIRSFVSVLECAAPITAFNEECGTKA